MHEVFRCCHINPRVRYVPPNSEASDVIEDLLGHSDFAMTQRYAHLSQEHKGAAVEKLVVRR